MSPTLDAFLVSWPFDPWLLSSLMLSAAVYFRGWLVLRRRAPRRWSPLQLASFMGGLSTIYLALASPIEPFSFLLLSVHMIQHLLLMMVAPPLLWGGAPLLPLIRGLPEPVRTYWVAPLFRVTWIRSLFQRLTHPVTALSLYVATTWLWHIPPIYDAALRSSAWHYAQHVCFLGVSILFWYPVVRPYPGHPRWSLWILFPYLILADVQNTVFSALLTFSNRILYFHYATIPRVGGISALDDQATAGVIMWVPGSVAFLVPLFVIGLRLLSAEPTGIARKPSGTPGNGPGFRGSPLPILGNAPIVWPSHGPFDLLRAPVVGRFLWWRHARLALQLPLLAMALALIVDGVIGPQVGAMNLAGVLPWTHWRGVVVLGLLGAGNVSCMACPFMLPRTLGRRWLPGQRRWPRILKGKWPAVSLILLFLWAYEAFSLWDRPWWTACIVVAYFVAALVVDGLFRGASFCKHVCPIGQFNFVQSQLSPLEVRVRDPGLCANCQTRDCIRGRDDLPGCELGLFQPRKHGNLDCTFCLDCAHACPHENVGILAGIPGRGLASNAWRSGVGQVSRRPDLAVVTLILVFGAFVNAAGMVGPVLDAEAWLQDRLRIQSSPVMAAVFLLLFLLMIPAVLVGAAVGASRHMGKFRETWVEAGSRYAQTLVPLGFAMWLAHYSFHFLTSWSTIIPTLQRFANDHGLAALGTPEWSLSCCRPISAWLLHLEIVFLDLGMLVSLHAAYQLSLSLTKRRLHALLALVPWAMLILLLYATGIWIIFQPMQMRGTLPNMG